MLPRPLTWFLILLTALVLPAALVSSWVAATVGETDEYVDTVAPLAQERVLLDAAHTEVERRVLARLGAPANTRPAVTEGVDRALTRVLDGPEFPPAWEQGNRILHRQVLRILEAEGTTTDDQWVRVDLTPLIDDITRALRSEGVRMPATLTDRDLEVNALRASDVEQARGYYDLLEKAGFWLPVAWLVLVAITLVTARRRIATLGHLAVGCLVTMGALALALVVARDQLIGGTEGTVAEVLWSTLTRGLWASLGVAATVAAVALTVRVVFGVVARRRH